MVKMKLNFSDFVGILAVLITFLGLLKSSQSLQVSHALSMNRYRQIYGSKREMSLSSTSNDADDDEIDVSDELFMELIANQKKIRHNKKQNKMKIQPVGPEFSRIVNIEQVPEKRPVLCKLVAKESERKALANRFDLPNLAYFAANVTVSKEGVATVLVEGTLEALITSPIMEEGQRIITDFETVLLNNIGASEKLSFDDNTDYDDEINANGDIDVGEIASQYLGMELL